MSLFADTINAMAKAAPRFPSEWGGGQWGMRLPFSRGMPGERDWSKIVWRRLLPYY